MPAPSLFDQTYKALVMGASGCLGAAFVAALRSDPLCTHVQGVSRSQGGGFDLLDDESLKDQAARCAPAGPYQLIIDATGVLSIDGVGPEKSLASIEPDRLIRSFQINALGPVLALRHFSPLLANGPSIYAKLSARVGSISDNKKGGWYGYRASKAALNMLLQTAAIELQRKNPALRVALLQPGTVRSPLSQAFLSSASPTLEPAESVAGLLKALKGLTPKPGAHYVDYKGETLAF